MAKSKCFHRLPLEVCQEIGLQIDSDKDLVSYLRICSATYNAIESDNYWFWRARFLQTYDNPDWKPVGPGYIRKQLRTAREMNNYKYKRQYVLRHKVLAKATRADPNSGNTLQQIQLQVLSELIRQSFSLNARGKAYPTLNLGHIEDLARSTRLDAPFSYSMLSDGAFNLREEIPGVVRLNHLQITELQCFLGPAILRRVSYSGRNGAASSFVTRSNEINEAYSTILFSFSEHGRWEIFGTDDEAKICTEPIVGYLNFWKEFLTRDGLYTTSRAYYELPEDKLPRWWDKRLVKNEELPGSRWLGAAGWIPDDLFENVTPESVQFHEETHTGPWDFEDARFEYVGADDLDWDDDWEAALQCRARALHWYQAGRTTRSTPSAFRFSSGGNFTGDDRTGMGWITYLPYEGTDGPLWKRFTMVMYEPGLNKEPLWLYDGVFLPGDQIIVGRKWEPVFDSVSGKMCAPSYRDLRDTWPFIFWAY